MTAELFPPPQRGLLLIPQVRKELLRLAADLRQVRQKADNLAEGIVDERQFRKIREISDEVNRVQRRLVDFMPDLTRRPSRRKRLSRRPKVPPEKIRALAAENPDLTYTDLVELGRIGSVGRVSEAITGKRR